MTCQSIVPKLDDYLDGSLDRAETAEVEDHVGGCVSCRDLIERAGELRRIVAKLPIAGGGPDFLERALVAAAGESEPGRVRRGRPRRHLGAIAAGLAIFTVLGWLLREPMVEPVSVGVAQVALAVEEPRTVNMVFASVEAVDGVSLTVSLPEGIELARYPGRNRVEWSTRLQAGNNVLPLELVALSGVGGELVATLRGDGKEKVFRIGIAVQSS